MTFKCVSFVFALYDVSEGKSAHYSRHPKCSQNCLISVELVLLYMFHTIFLMGN